MALRNIIRPVSESDYLLAKKTGKSRYVCHSKWYRSMFLRLHVIEYDTGTSISLSCSTRSFPLEYDVFVLIAVG